MEEEVWRIQMRDIGTLGHVVCLPDGTIRYQLSSEVISLIDKQIKKIAHMPLALRRSMVREFFSCYLRVVSDGLCWAEFLPDFDLDARRYNVGGSIESQPYVASDSHQFLYLRRFANPVPTLSIVADAVCPAEVSYVPAPIRQPRSIRACYFFERLIHARAYSHVRTRAIQGDGWLKMVASIAGNFQGVVIDTYLFSLRGAAVATGLEGEMGLSMMLPLTVARVYMARDDDVLPRWIPEDLVVRVPRKPGILQRMRHAVAKAIRMRLDENLQHAWRPFYERCQVSWDRVMALSGVRYDRNRGVVPWDA